jgi:anhydro-N-acetylmuramic acid kinase
MRKETGPLWVAGCMSGTSLDGVDVALVLTDGRAIVELGPTAYRPYGEAERATLRAALGRWPGERGVEEAARLVEAAHAEALASLPDGGPAPALVGFHGQTLAHDPRGRGTHQCGDGGRLAALTGRRVVWDFRSADVALGGQGAPLAPFYHVAMAQAARIAAPVAILNLGGVGNVTWADPAAPGPEAPGALLAFDTGPANAPIDDLVRARLGAARDEGGALALAGRADAAVVARFLADPFFARVPPKSLDRDAFAALIGAVDHLGVEDACATLVACVAGAVAAGAVHLPAPPARWLVGGGGRRNPALMAALAARLSAPVEPVEAIGFDGDMIEAQAFAYLAARVVRGLPTSAPGTTGVAACVGGGQVSDPPPG